MVEWLQHFLDVLRSRSLGDFCVEVSGNGFFFFVGGLVGRVDVGAAYLDETDLVLLGFSVVAAAGPPEVPPFILLNPLGLVIVGLLGVCCKGTGIGASAFYPSSVIAAMMSSRCFASARVRVTLVATAFSSASIGSASLSEAWGVITFSLSFLERTGIKGSSAGSSSSS